MIVDFFDHFIALKQLVEDSGKVRVLSEENNMIIFTIEFYAPDDFNKALSNINSLGGTIVIYGRAITIGVEVLADMHIKIALN
jgi:hypothetical protein